MADNNGAIGWDDEVSDADAGNNGSGERDAFVVLPEGEYDFTVNKVERGSFGGSAKLPPCGMVKVGIILDGGNKGRSYVTTRFFMHTKTLWQIYEFLTALGLHKQGEGATCIPWNKVEKGMTGRCKAKIHTYNDTQSNEVAKWLASAGAASAKSNSLDDIPF